MNLPCKKDKCLIYCICINKEEIDCEYLKKYYKYYRVLGVKNEHIWKAINTTLSNCKRIVAIRKGTDGIINSAYTNHRSINKVTRLHIKPHTWRTKKYDTLLR